MKDPNPNDWRRAHICKHHPSLFAHVCGSLNDIEIVKMDWNYNITRSDDELRKIGRQSKVKTRRYEADSLVATLLQMADEESADSIAKLQLTTE